MGESTSSMFSTSAGEAATLSASSELVRKYEESFPAKEMQEFLKSLDRLQVGLWMRPNRPLVINHKLGAEDSFVRLILAPRIDEAC